MKKLISFTLVLCMLFLFAGCGKNSKLTETQQPTNETEQNNIQETNSENKAESNSIVVYFSRTGEQYGVGVIEKGNTAIVADMIAEYTGADTFEILPKDDKYPTTYDTLTEYAKTEQNENARPEIASKIDNFDKYDTVFLGYPIWWGDMPMIVYTFLENYNFNGKTIIPFCTHAGSGNAGTKNKIEKIISNAEIKDVLAIRGTDTQNAQESVKSEVNKWLKDLDF